MFADRIRRLNKYVTNPLLRWLAYLPIGPFAIIHHIGRHSAKSYETVIMVWPKDVGFVIALTYGKSVDWYRNVLAAGGGTLLWHRSVYVIGKPESLDVQTALPTFPAPLRPILRSAVQDFVLVKSSGSQPD